MSQAKGSRAQLLGGVAEANFGSTPGSISAILLPIISSNIRQNRNLIETNVIRSRRDAAAPTKGVYDVSGDVVVPVDVNNIGYWLWMILGNASSDQSVAPYHHIFQVQSDLPSFVMEQGYVDISEYLKYNGCMGNSIAFAFDAGADAELTATVNIMGQVEAAPASASIDASPSEHSLKRFEITDLALEEGGSPIANVAVCNITISNNLDGSQYVVGGAGKRGDILEGLCQVSGNIEALFENETLYNKARNSTESSLKATLTSGSHSLELLINELVFSEESPGIPGPQGIRVNLPFRAYYDDKSPDVTIIQAILYNEVSAFTT